MLGKTSALHYEIEVGSKSHAKNVLFLKTREAFENF